MSDIALGEWIEKQFKERKKLFGAEKDKKNKEKLLYSLAKLLRQYINTFKTKQGLGNEQREKAYKMTAWLQSELLKGDWSSNLSYCFDAVLYARKYSGNIAVEGRALRASLTKSERHALASLTRKANSRFNRSLGELDIKDSDRLDDLRDLALLPDSSEMDQDSDPRGVPGDSNGDS